MSNRKIALNESELDRALQAEEAGMGAQLLKAIREEAQPRAKFVQQLESRLRQKALAQRPAATTLRLPRFTWAKPFLLAGASLLLLVALGGLFWLHQAEPVSAEQVLERAAAPHLAPNAVMHLVYKQEQQSRPPTTGTGDVWVQADARGSIIRTAMTFTGFNADGSTQTIERMVIDGQNAQQYDYDPRNNTVRIQTGTAQRIMGDNPNYFDGASVAKYLNQVARGGLHGVRLLPSQSFYGVPVQAVQTDSDGGMTFYFDAQTYVLRGAQGGRQRIWLAQSETRTTTTLPPDAFAFSPPEGARVVKEDTSHDSNAPGFRLSREQLASICHLTPAALDAASVADKTPLAACQQGDPTMTADQLVAALLAHYQGKLDEAVAAGNLTAAQASENLANLRIKLNQWATMPLGK